MLKATSEMKKRGSVLGDNQSVFKKREQGTRGVEKKSESVFKKGKTSEYVLKGSREPVELKKSEGVFKKGETTGRTKKERGECFEKYIFFFLNAKGNLGTKEKKRGRQLKV